MNSSLLIVLILSCIWIITQSAVASKGDSAVEFQLCLSECVASGCPETGQVLFGLFPSWSCRDECRYSCMWEQEEKKRSVGKPAVQYYGKWPFRRILGIQEPFSTLFSIFNAVPHLREMVWRRDKLAPPRLDPTLRFLSLVSVFVAFNTWIWSTAFHAKDNWFNERMDYHFATLHMIFYLLYAICRLTLLVKPRDTFVFTSVAGIILGTVFSYHVWYMNAVKFDYGWNMIVTGTFVVLQFLVWMVWAAVTIRNPPEGSPSKSRSVAKMIIKFQFSLLSFAAFEAFDFPPLFDQLDAHAIWHGLTVGLGFYWYKFRETDAQLLITKQGGSVSV